MTRKLKPYYNENWFPEGFTQFDLMRIPIENQWTREMVEDRMVEAQILLDKTESKPSPEKPGSNWPRHRYEWSDLLSQAENPEASKKFERWIFNPSCKDITEMETVLRWQTKYLGDHPGAARVLNLYLKAKAIRKPFQVLVEERKWSRATAYRLKERALTMIAIGLMKDKVSPWR